MEQERSKTISAPASAVWSVLADFGALATWAPMAQHSCLISAQAAGVGAARRVQIARQTLIERVTEWEPERGLAYTIEGLPPVVGATTNRWRLLDRDDHTEVTLTTEIDPGIHPVKMLASNRALARLTQGSEMMLAGLDRAAASSRAMSLDL